ncbi:MAG: hypothetical protein NTY74_05055 [Ignavibacteriae bacterium]|nr:hypothetical protein [Ignavibacteriota bacterium]
MKRRNGIRHGGLKELIRANWNLVGKSKRIFIVRAKRFLLGGVAAKQTGWVGGVYY